MRDDELGSRVERALRAHAVDAPAARDLAGVARRRLRRRRRAVMATAAVTVGVIAIGGAWSSLGGQTMNDSSTAGAGSAEAPPASDAQDGRKAAQPEQAAWRWESFGGVEVSVPAAWTYGISDSPWCIDNRGQANGEVGRPGPVRSIKCPDEIPTGLLGEHVWLSGAGAGRPQGEPATQVLGAGWVRDVILVGSVRIEVQSHANPSVRDRILGSVREVSTDRNGCPADDPVSAGGWNRPKRGLGWTAQAVTGVSICRYGIESAGGHPLIASVRQGADGAARLLDAIRAASPGEGPDDPGGMPDQLGSEATVLRFDTADGVREIYLRYSGSRHNGFDNGTEVRRLTREAVAFMTGPLVVYAGPHVTMELLPRR